MKVAICVEANATVGTGHLFRCKTLAEELEGRGAEILWIEKESSAARASIEKKFGKADWLVTDDYALDAKWESGMRAVARRILAIDDLADRPHDCDLLLDQNLSVNPLRYEGLVPRSCVKALGPRYALLRREFRVPFERLRKRDGKVRRVLVFFGGADATNETLKALRVAERFSSVNFDVVIGKLNPNLKMLEKACKALPHVELHVDVSNMGELMNKADLAIGAGGTSLLERARMGLPALTVVVAENQRPGTEAAAKAGALWNLGPQTQVSDETMAKALESVLKNPPEVRERGERGLSLFDDVSALRVADLMQEHSIRELQESDLEKVLEWRNSDRVRAHMYTDHVIAPEEHRAWYQKLKADPTSKTLIYQHWGKPQGVVNFTKINPADKSCTWGFYIGEPDAPKGAGTIMGDLALSYVFETYKLEQVHGEAFAFNEASVGYHKKLGFVKVEPRFKPMVKNGKPEEVLSFVLKREDWEKRHA